MKLIIGLGNPGEEYKNSRHNVGHMVVDKIKNSKSKKFKDLMVFKTDTFMNSSGGFVENMVNNHAIKPESLYIIHDDLDIPLGSFKIQFGKGPKNHNGLKSVDHVLGTGDYWHVRVGIEHRTGGSVISGEEYVLGNFDAEEKNLLDNAIDLCVKNIAKIVQ